MKERLLKIDASTTFVNDHERAGVSVIQSNALYPRPNARERGKPKTIAVRRLAGQFRHEPASARVARKHSYAGAGGRVAGDIGIACGMSTLPPDGLASIKTHLDLRRIINPPI